ncbi:MAG: ABC transporter ATP-binding protein [Lachnospiraceae bacterium]|nr:ABC transporter ATP-binding protein [Lachnospiraceae bacterium]MDY5741630.1 ABC transporter ATP-binding protein [Lachnospiraceae bacterium]
MTDGKKRRGALTIMGRLIGLLGGLAPIMALAVIFGVIGFLMATALGVLGGIGLLGILDGQTGAAGILPGSGIGQYPFASLSLTTVIAALLVFAVLRSFLQYAEQLCNHYIAFRILAQIRHRIFAKMRLLAPAKLETRQQGDLVAMVTSDIELLEVFYAHTISPILIALLTCLALLIFQALIHPVFAGIALLCYLLVGVAVPIWAARKGRTKSRQVRRELATVNSFLLESLTGIRELMQYQQENRRIRRISDMTRDVVQKQTELKQDSGRVAAVVDGIIVCGAVLVILTTILLNGRGIVTFGQGLIAGLTLIASFGPVAALAGLGTTLLPTLAAGDRILELLEEVPQISENTTGQTPVFSEIEMKDVDFTYDEIPILEKLSMKIRSGRILGLAGRSGRGKSTILKLLMRFWDVTGGQILIDGVDIRDIRTKHIFGQVAYMTQQTVLFTGTIGENIRIGKPTATEAELIEACRKASIYELIRELPQGFDTWVTELGENFSGGERQRIGLARCLLADHSLLLLDEPTSNLDRMNEALILRALKRETQGRTVVLVSHRASTLAIADEVIQL